MKHFPVIKNLIGGITLAFVLVLTPVAAANAATGSGGKTPPTNNLVSGKQDKPQIAPGSKDAKQSERLGSTNLVKTDANGNLDSSAQTVSPMAGYVSNVDFQNPLNYCWRNLVYAPVTNTTAATKYIQVRLYNQGTYHDIYTSVSANSTTYPAFYGINGAYTAYLYVWNGSYYQYDEYKSGNNTCNVSVTRTYNSGGWVQLKIQNLGTAYATQQSTELAPYPGSGTYTGTHYDYPAAGGAAIYRWFWVGTNPYGIVSQTYGSFNSPYFFTGDL